MKMDDFLRRYGRRSHPRRFHPSRDNLRLTIGVITLVLLATLIGVAPAILIALFHYS